MATTHKLRAKLFFNKKTYRDIEIKSSATLYNLASAIIDSFGFDFDHAFGFYSKCSAGSYYDSDERYELFADMGEVEANVKGVKKTAISVAFRTEKQKMLFLFDYGDDWMFEIEVLGFGEQEKGAKYPRVIKSKGDAPEQYPDFEEEDDEELGDLFPLEGSIAKKAEIQNYFFQEISKIMEAGNLSEEELHKKMEELSLKMEGNIAAIEAMEIEEENTANPENKNQKELVKFFEGKQKPNEELLELWLEEKWGSLNQNFPLFRKYIKQKNKQLESLVAFGLDEKPDSVELINDFAYIYNLYEMDGRRPELEKRLINGCDAINDPDAFKEVLSITVLEFSELDQNILGTLKERYKANKMKSKIIKDLMKDTAPANFGKLLAG